MKNRSAIERTLIIKKEMEAFKKYLKKIKSGVQINLLRAEQLLSKVNSINSDPTEKKKYSG